MKRFIFLVALLLALPAVASAQGISQLQQFTSTTTPSSAITQTTYGKALKITGLTTGQCLTLNASNILTTTACGSGGGGTFPFTPFASYNATSTALGFLSGLFSTASSTFNSAFNLPALSAGGLGVNENGTVYSTPTSTLSTITGSLALTKLAAQAANTVIANGTGASAVPAAVATSSLFQNASASITGLLSSTDWSTFNGKQAAGNYITALTGDITASGPGSSAATLATVNSNVGSFTNASITVNGKGLITAASSGSAPEVPLTFTWPLIRSTNTITYGGLSTSTAAVVGNIPYFSGVNTFANVATGTLSCSSPLSCTSRSVIGGSSALTLDTSGTWTGNAGTASALAANGTNASAGNAILGVDASGNAEGAFDVWTEAENTAAAYTPQSRQLTVAGTAGQISSSAGAQSLAADRTWTLSLPSHVIFPSSFQVANSTTTNATTTGTFTLPVGSAVITPIAGNIAIDTTTGQLRYSDVTGTSRVVPNFQSASISYATSTAWTGTTTILLGPATAAETWASVQCFTDAGTLGVSFYDGTNRMNYMPTASTTVNVNTLTTNNSFTPGEKRYVDIGNPASSPTKVSCSVRKSYDAD
jgi:hypothetical protein